MDCDRYADEKTKIYYSIQNKNLRTIWHTNPANDNHYSRSNALFENNKDRINNWTSMDLSSNNM